MALLNVNMDTKLVKLKLNGNKLDVMLRSEAVEHDAAAKMIEVLERA